MNEFAFLCKMMYNIIILTHIVRFLGGYHMITAKEAREQVNILLSKAEEDEQKRAEEKITEAVKAGAGFCHLDVYISKVTESWLLSLGYKVEKISSSQHGTSDTVVYW